MENYQFIQSSPESSHSIATAASSAPTKLDGLNRKIEHWKNQLFDLGKRNKMINYHETKRSTLRILEPEFSELFTRLVDNEEELTFQRPIDKDSDLRTFTMLSLLETLSYPLPVHLGDIKTEGTILERQKTLKNLRSKAKLAKDEQGTNILYLAFGFIEWKENAAAGSPWLKSPLIMVPISLKLESIYAPYILSRYEDDVEVNPTLDYLFNKEYGVDLPTFENGMTIDEYMEIIEEIVDKRGWKLIREVSMGLLSFMKISMYHDLNNNYERMINNPVIRAITGNLSAAVVIPSEFDFDSVEPVNWYQVVTADSSQQEAIQLSKIGVSFVMQGPPGTGKSQTITNIIAEALADGKRVLFVSEKAAALQVVYKRLTEVHLDDFCLPLHNHKANKKEILEAIGDNLQLPHARVKDSVLAELNELFNERKYLNQYAHELHAEIAPLGETLYGAFGKLAKLNTATVIHFTLDNPAAIPKDQFYTMLYRVKSYERVLKSMACKLSENPWHGAVVTATSGDFKMALVSDTQGLGQELGELSSMLKTYQTKFGIKIPNSWHGVQQLIIIFDAIKEVPLFPFAWHKKDCRTQLLAVAEKAKQAKETYLENLSAVQTYFCDDIFDIDLADWQKAVDSDVSAIQSVGIYSSYTYLDLFRDAGSICENISTLQKQLHDLVEKYIEISAILHSEGSDSFDNMIRLARLVRMMLTKVIVRREWFDPFKYGQAKRLLKTAKIHADNVSEQTKAILEQWEKQVFDIDADAMLGRFKTEYTGIFKIFKSSYRKDIKAIRSVYKTVVKKIRDQTVIALLQSLKNLNTEKQWLTENEAQLKACFGYYYLGFDTDWASLDAGLSFIANLRAVFDNGEVPQIIINMLSQRSAYSPQYVLLSTAARLLTETNIVDARTKTESIFASTAIAAINSIKGELASQLEKLIVASSDIVRQVNSVATYLKTDVDMSELREQVRKVFAVKSAKVELLAEGTQISGLFNERYQELSTDWDSIIADIRSVDDLFSKEEWSGIEAAFVKLFCDDSRLRIDLIEAGEALRRQYAAMKNRLYSFVKLFEKPDSFYTMDLLALTQRFNSCLNNCSMLDKWIDYKETGTACIKAGLADFTARVDEQDNTIPDVYDAFRRGFYRQWVSAVLDNKDSVRQFRRRVHDARIDRFVTLDEQQLAVAQMRIRDKIISTFPDPNRIMTANDELSILQHELGKKRRIMPLRKLFRLIPHLLLTLKPCLMMSPLSVAYFLEAESYQFDMVIFDEASQIFPQDAIGAIFRGKQVIIAGDSQQLPPTNFFITSTSNTDNDFDRDDDDEIEKPLSGSILEEAVAARLPNRTLKWHYRSKHEHLIAFSNQNIYNRALITFPSPIECRTDTGVEFIYVEDGIYEGGVKNCNIREAQKCVELVKEHIEKHPTRSLGIIAFSKKQQQAIFLEVQRFREQNTEYEDFFAEGKEEEFFVKNLENVQGDERDTIIFSIGYAKDKNGKMHLRFGPLSHQGGERRLNVAITRAKQNVKLISSIRPSDIDLSRTDSEGVKMLRLYIEFAMNGTASLRTGQANDGSNDNFVDTICHFIESQGYRTRQHVGCSGYKIDIAVEHPEKGGCFVAGIECDGFSYIAAKTARDRDHLRKFVLQAMGWNMYRVWSAEWIKNAEIEGEKLLTFIADSIRNYEDDPSIPTPIPATAPQAEEMIEKVKAPKIHLVNSDVSGNPYGFDYYVEAQWFDAPNRGGNYGEDCVRYIVGIEQPIHKELLYQRMAGAYGRQKVTAPVKNTVDGVIKKKPFVVDQDGFVTLEGFTDIHVRIPKHGDTPRPITNISPPEIGLAMLTIIANTYGLTEEGLIEETVRVLGYARKGDRIMSCLRDALTRIKKQGKVKLIDGKFNLVEGA